MTKSVSQRKTVGGHSYRASPAVIAALERIAFGCWPRERSGLLPNEIGATPNMSKPDWELAQELLDAIRLDATDGCTPK